MNENIKIFRDENGVAHIEADNKIDVYRAMGYMHAKDRGMQMLLMRILGQGRLSELLDSSESSLNIDKFFRKVNWKDNIEQNLNKLSNLEKDILDAYCQGANESFAKKYRGNLSLWAINRNHGQ